MGASGLSGGRRRHPARPRGREGWPNQTRRSVPRRVRAEAWPSALSYPTELSPISPPFTIGSSRSRRETRVSAGLAPCERRFASLSALPTRCPISAESRDSPVEVRQLLYGRKPHVYRILFAVDGDSVQVLHVRHARRRPLAKP